MELDKQHIMSMFDGKTAEELVKKYTVGQLRTYYSVLYGSYPGGGLRKVDIVKKIQMMKRGIDRALSMKP